MKPPNDELAIGNRVSRPVIPDGEEKKPHRFWDSQPVPKVADNVSTECGPLDEAKTTEDISRVPLTLPDPFSWTELDILRSEELDELVELLSQNYVEDDDACFRFNYSRDCLMWALTPPNFQRDWHLGVRANGKLVAFISAIPARVSIHTQAMDLAEVNFLCIHKKLRHRRLAPVLIKEITRRINRQNIWQALYTAGIFLPRPVGESQYWHRSLNIRTLVDVGFSQLPPKQNLRIAERLLSLPSESELAGVREMTANDCAQVQQLFEKHFSSRKPSLHPVFSIDDVHHWLLPRSDVLHSFVREVDGVVTDFFSFYSLPSKVIKHNSKYDHIEVAYCYYMAATSVKHQALLNEALIAAKRKGFDVFNALDLGDNRESFESLKFGVGDGCLRYYLYNWKCPLMKAEDLMLVLL